MNVRIVIPARLSSSRLPGKVLADLGGRPVLAHVVQAANDSDLGAVWVASDSDEVLDVARAAGAHAMRTRSDHPSGSDRINEVASTQGWKSDDVLVNLQGDEPFMPVELLRAVTQTLTSSEADWATVASPISDTKEFRNPACVKVVCALDGRALYFSRAPIPHERDADGGAVPATALRHVGLYSYRVGALARYCAQSPSPLEQLEKLEQLRALECGMRIQVHVAKAAPPPGIDTPDDLEIARQKIKKPPTRSDGGFLY